MSSDFYLPDHALASYFEKDWGDHVAEGKSWPPFLFHPFNKSKLYSPYHERLVELLDAEAQPARLLEIGASLGRTYYELCRRYASLRNALLAEPSQNLAHEFGRIFGGFASERFRSAVPPLDTATIRAACAHVRTTLRQETFQNLQQPLGIFDLVVCSNVIDQCTDPGALVRLLQEATAAGGMLVLSCTYQWQDKYIGNAVEPIRDIKQLFNSGWKLYAEAELPFQLRVNERHWMRFLSHAIVMYRN